MEEAPVFNHILDTNGLANMMKEEIKNEIRNLVRAPILKIVGNMDNPSIRSYYKQIVRNCDEFGIKVVEDTLDYVLDELIEYNQNKSTLDYHGLLILLPLKNDHDKIKYSEIRKLIPPEVDVDRINSTINKYEFIYQPATIRAIFDTLDYNEIKIEGKMVTVLGRSENIGLPCVNEFIRRDACVATIHSKVSNYKSAFLPISDIVVTSAGVSKLLSTDDLPKNAIVIDVGCNVDSDGKLHGDFDHKNIEDTNIRYTPVPNGIGKITTLELLMNTVNTRRKILVRR